MEERTVGCLILTVPVVGASDLVYNVSTVPYCYMLSDGRTNFQNASAMRLYHVSASVRPSCTRDDDSCLGQRQGSRDGCENNAPHDARSRACEGLAVHSYRRVGCAHATLVARIIAVAR
jgi:hypothetical protein